MLLDDTIRIYVSVGRILCEETNGDKPKKGKPKTSKWKTLASTTVREETRASAHYETNSSCWGEANEPGI
ncbi:hypothetical protein BLOT_007764 [Blomia tropicalis]|nr:hypothetical protein BLOT_007764 [Blomia tropicalis]